MRKLLTLNFKDLEGQDRRDQTPGKHPKDELPLRARFDRSKRPATAEDGQIAGNEHGAAITYGQLGIVAGLQGDLEESGKWLTRCIKAFINTNDLESAKRNTGNFLVSYRKASSGEQAKLRAIWEQADLGPFPEVPEPQEKQ